MARMVVTPTLVQGKLTLSFVDHAQRLREEATRLKNIMDRTRVGSDFAPLGLAVGITTAEAADLYSRMVAFEEALNTTLFQNLADIDQG